MIAIAQNVAPSQAIAIISKESVTLLAISAADLMLVLVTCAVLSTPVDHVKVVAYIKQGKPFLEKKAHLTSSLM
jgi:hypothetical protein